jgi:hypothetical protein
MQKAAFGRLFVFAQGAFCRIARSEASPFVQGQSFGLEGGVVGSDEASVFFAPLAQLNGSLAICECTLSGGSLLQYGLRFLPSQSLWRGRMQSSRNCAA